MSQPRRMVVLVAEDEEADYEFLKCMLQRAPLVSIFRVADGEQTLDYLKGNGRFCDRLEFPLPDILVLDLNLPKISGLDLLKWIARQDGFEAMRITILTGSDNKADRERANRSGAHDYFIKPLSLGHIATLFSPRP